MRLQSRRHRVARYVAVLGLVLAAGCRQVEDTRAITERWITLATQWNDTYTAQKVQAGELQVRFDALAKPDAASPAFARYTELASQFQEQAKQLDEAKVELEKAITNFNAAKIRGKNQGIVKVVDAAAQALPAKFEAVAATLVRSQEALTAYQDAPRPLSLATLAQAGGTLNSPELSKAFAVDAGDKHTSTRKAFAAFAKACPELRFTLTEVPANDGDKNAATVRLADMQTWLRTEKVSALAVVGASVRRTPAEDGVMRTEISVVAPCPAPAAPTATPAAPTATSAAPTATSATPATKP